MTTITISGHKFEVPEGVLARYQIGTVLNTEGEVSTIRQTLCENLRNNFASTVKKEANGEGELPEEKRVELQAKFDEYANGYSFGVRAVGGGGTKRIIDPVEREMNKLAKDAISKAYQVKYGEKIDKEQLAVAVEKLLEVKHDDYAKRARAILRQREQAGADDLASVGL